MNMWVVIGIVIGVLTIVGTLLTLRSKNVRVPFLVGFNTLLPVACVFCYYGETAVSRKVVIMAMVTIYLIRMNWVLVAWYGFTGARKLDGQIPMGQVYGMPLILCNTFGWLYCLPFYFAMSRVGPLGVLDFASIAVYAVGTLIHFGADYQKKRFKENPENQGKILDTGLWGLSRHPNYLGDFLIYASWAVIGGSWWGIASPLTNLLQYLFDAIPKNEKMAAERYGDDWEQYAQKTRMFVPFVL